MIMKVNLGLIFLLIVGLSNTLTGMESISAQEIGSSPEPEQTSIIGTSPEVDQTRSFMDFPVPAVHTLFGGIPGFFLPPDSLLEKQTITPNDSAATLKSTGHPTQSGASPLQNLKTPEKEHPDIPYPERGTPNLEMAIPAGQLFTPEIPFSEGVSLSALPLSGKMLAHPLFPEWQPPDFSSLLFSRWRIDSGSSLYYPFHFRNPGLLTRNIPLVFGGTATLFNQASYQISDRLQVGGNSFGISPPWARPSLPGGDNRYDFRGASMFMEYKVSPNFRIGTSISVSGNHFSP